MFSEIIFIFAVLTYAYIFYSILLSYISLKK